MGKLMINPPSLLPLAQVVHEMDYLASEERRDKDEVRAGMRTRAGPLACTATSVASPASRAPRIFRSCGRIAARPSAVFLVDRCRLRSPDAWRGEPGRFGDRGQSRYRVRGRAATWTVGIRADR